MSLNVHMPCNKNVCLCNVGISGILGQDGSDILHPLTEEDDLENVTTTILQKLIKTSTNARNLYMF